MQCSHATWPIKTPVCPCTRQTDGCDCSFRRNAPPWNTARQGQVFPSVDPCVGNLSALSMSDRAGRQSRHRRLYPDKTVPAGGQSRMTKCLLGSTCKPLKGTRTLGATITQLHVPFDEEGKRCDLHRIIRWPPLCRNLFDAAFAGKFQSRIQPSTSDTSLSHQLLSIQVCHEQSRVADEDCVPLSVLRYQSSIVRLSWRITEH